MSRRLIYAYFADVFNNYTSSSTIIKMKREEFSLKVLKDNVHTLGDDKKK